MRLYWELSKLAFKRQMSYRAATLAGLVTNFFFGLLRAAIFIALYQAREQVAGMTLADTITYTALTQASIAYLSLFSWYDLMRTVYSGEIATDLLKPIKFYNYWLAQDMGRALASFLTRGVLIMIAYELVVDMVYPKGMGWVYLAVSIILAWLVSFSWRFLISLTAFWTPNATGILRFFFLSAVFFSGFLMPLRFFPDWVVSLINFTPFPATVNTTVDIFLGLLSGQELIYALGIQVLWTAILVLAGQVVLRAGVRRLVILGG
jgi:ABC-2 type transport system permease protein